MSKAFTRNEPPRVLAKRKPFTTLSLLTDPVSHMPSNIGQLLCFIRNKEIELHSFNQGEAILSHIPTPTLKLHIIITLKFKTIYEIAFNHYFLENVSIEFHFKIKQNFKKTILRISLQVAASPQLIKCSGVVGLKVLQKNQISALPRPISHEFWRLQWNRKLKTYRCTLIHYLLIEKIPTRCILNHYLLIEKTPSLNPTQANFVL